MVINAAGGMALPPQKHHHQCCRLIISKLFLMWWCGKVIMPLEVWHCYHRNTTTNATDWLLQNCFWHVKGPPPEKHSSQWCRLIFYFSMWCWMVWKCHQWTLSPMLPVNCFSNFSTKVNGTKVGCMALLSMCNAIASAVAWSTMSVAQNKMPNMMHNATP